MYEIIQTLYEHYVPEILMGLAIVLVLIDYCFPTDVPCHFGYFCFGAAVFFIVPLAPLPSLLTALATWGLLALLHAVWFRHFLENAPDEEPESPGAQTAEVE